MTIQPIKRSHGGKRKGAGRKPSPYGACMSVALPKIWKNDYKQWLKDMKMKHDQTR